MITIRPLIAASAMACASLSWAGAPALVELGRTVPGFGWPGHGGFAIADFDGDGLDDIVVSGTSGTALFQVLGQGADGLVSRQQVFVPDGSFARVLVASIAGSPQLVTVSAEGRVRRFAGWPLVEMPSLDLGLDEVSSAAVGDIDNDGSIELVVSHWWSPVGLHAYSLESGELLWSIENQPADDILLAQLDADPALEIVLATTPGLVIDGATQATDWSYLDGFGSYLASGRFQAGGGNQFVAAHDWDRLVVFQSAPWSPLWDLKMFDIDAVAAADLDGDGFDDIIEGDGQWGQVNIIDGQTHAIRLSIAHNGHGVSGVAAWDPDGDGTSDIAISPRSPQSFTASAFLLADSVDGHTLGMLPNGELGPYQNVAVGRVAGGTRFVYPVIDESHGGSWIEVDGSTGQQQWRSPEPDEQSDLFDLTPQDALYVEDGVGGMQLVLAGDGWPSNGSRFIALDAQTHEVRWMVDANTLEVLARPVRGAKALDLGGPPVIAACLADYQDARILLLDAESGAPLWNSVAMSTAESECSLMAGRFQDGANPLVVAVLDSSLRAYDAATHLLAWTLAGPADGASLIEHGIAGREFVVFEGSHLHFHDAATRALLRTFDLALPVSAVQPIEGDIHRLVVAAGGHLQVVDGASGAVLQSTGYLGHDLGKGNRIATSELGGGYILAGTGSDGGVFRHRLYTGDGIFTDGFDLAVD